MFINNCEKLKVGELNYEHFLLFFVENHSSKKENTRFYAKSVGEIRSFLCLTDNLPSLIVMSQITTESVVLESIWNLNLESIIAGATSVQHPQRLFHSTFFVSNNNATFSTISVTLVVVAREQQKKNSSFNKPE